MKRIVFISANRRRIEKITAIINSRHDMNFQLLSTTYFSEAINDIIEFKADIVVFDTTQNESLEKITALLSQIQEVNTVQKCLVMTGNLSLCKENTFEEYILYDDGLEKLFCRLAGL